MIEFIQVFIKRLQEREHVLELIRNTDLTIDILTNKQSISVSINHGDIYISNNLDDQPNKYIIEGSVCVIKELIEGRHKLRTFIKKGELSIKAPFRTLLLLESLFYLTNPKKNI